MAFNQGLAPFSWTPSSQNVMGPNSPIIGTPFQGGGQVRAGDWVQVFVSFRQGSSAVQYLLNRFLIHVIYTPNSDDATPHEDQATTYGGSAANRRRNYRIDPGVAFQVPFNGQLSIIAGDNSDPARCVVDVLLVRGHAPFDVEKELANRQAEVVEELEELTDIAMYGRSMRDPALGPVMHRLGPTRRYPPPIVGSPQLVHATWVDVPLNVPIQFPDGAEFVEVVNDSGVPGSPVRLVIAALGGAFALNCASGILRTIGAYGQGGACVGGTPATWTSPVALTSLTVWSRLGG